MRLIDADALKRRVQRVATEAWKLKLEAKVETTLNQFLDYVEQSPTIDAVSVEWIPCEKRLPEETMLCLVTIKEQVTPIIDWWVADEPTTPDPAPGKWKDNKLTHIAWMPLMEPYEERRNNG